MIYFLIAFGALIVGAIITSIIVYFIPKEKIHTTNQMLLQKEQQIQLDIKDLEKQYIEKSNTLNKEYQQHFETLEKQQNELKQIANQQQTKIEQSRQDWEIEKGKKLLEWSNQEAEIKAEVRGLEKQKEAISSSILQLQKEAETSGEIFKQKSLEIAQLEVDKAKTEMRTNFETATDKAKQAYLEMLETRMAEFKAEYEKIQQQLKNALSALNDVQAKVEAATASNRRAELDRQKKDFYRIQLSEADIIEIEKIRSIEPYLRDKEPLNKVIWKSYYEKPTSDLIGRIVGAGTKTGIYKITNLDNGMCYVGQAVNIGR